MPVDPWSENARPAEARPADMRPTDPAREPEAAPVVPTRAAVRETAINITRQSAPKQRQLDTAAQETVELDGRQRFFSLRDTWSRWIIIWISASIATNVVLTFMVGAGLLDFSKYGWFINAITAESFIQVVGLGYVAVRFLFSRG